MLRTGEEGADAATADALRPLLKAAGMVRTAVFTGVRTEAAGRGAGVAGSEYAWVDT